MSKNISIKKDGAAQSLNGVGRISVPRPDGSDADWVPEDEVQLSSIEITANGQYKASDFLGAYGFHTVHVHVPKEGYVVGIGQDGRGYKIYEDQSTGQIVRQQIPTAIAITTPPTKTEYAPGETLVYTGMVVTLKNKDGTTYTDTIYSDGTILLSDLILEATTAEKDKRRIPVYWLNPYTNHVHKTYFWITITEE